MTHHPTCPADYDTDEAFAEATGYFVADMAAHLERRKVGRSTIRCGCGWGHSEPGYDRTDELHTAHRAHQEQEGVTAPAPTGITDPAPTDRFRVGYMRNDRPNRQPQTDGKVAE